MSKEMVINSLFNRVIEMFPVPFDCANDKAEEVILKACSPNTSKMGLLFFCNLWNNSFSFDNR